MRFFATLSQDLTLLFVPLVGLGHDRSFDSMVHQGDVHCAVLSDAVPLVISRQLLQAFTNEIKEKLSRDVHKDVATL